MITSISYDQQEIINNIISLYVPDGRFTLDPCYSKGVFYKNNVVPEPEIKMDIYPQYDDVLNRDCRDTHLDNESVKSIIFDPPFLATSGKSLSEQDNRNRINKRFGVYKNESELWNMYEASIHEFSRILVPNGILCFKCQDKVSGGKQYIMHNKIINECEKSGFRCEDIFVLLAKSRIVANWQLQNQKHARKFHSYFIVFVKT